MMNSRHLLYSEPTTKDNKKSDSDNDNDENYN